MGTLKLNLEKDAIDKINEKLVNTNFKKIDKPKKEKKNNKKDIKKYKKDAFEKGYRKIDKIDYILYKLGIRYNKVYKTYAKIYKLQPYKLKYCDNLRYNINDFYKCKKETGIAPFIILHNFFIKDNKKEINIEKFYEKYNKLMEKMGHSDLKETFNKEEYEKRRKEILIIGNKK